MPFIQFQLRRGTTAMWATTNPVLAAGEMALETNTNRFKFGDGVLAWNALPYGGTIQEESVFSSITVADTTSTNKLFANTISTASINTSNIDTTILDFTNKIKIIQPLPQSIAIGYNNGLNQSMQSIAIGAEAGYLSQEPWAVAIGTGTGYNFQKERAVALGTNAGYAGQEKYAIAIGDSIGLNAVQGENSIGIGRFAGADTFHSSTIILNATGSNVNTDKEQAFYVAPIATRTNPQTFSTLYYDANTKEVFAGPVPNGGGGFVDSNFGFSNLKVLDTVSTSSTFTDYLSAGQIYASSLYVQSAVITGSNTLTVYGQSYLSTLTITGQLLISTASGEGNLVGSNFGFSNLDVLDTTSTSNLFTNYASTTTLWAQDAFISSLICVNNVRITESKFPSKIAIGNNAASQNQADFSIAIGQNAGQIQQTESIAVGYETGFNQGSRSLAIGSFAGQENQGNDAVAIGRLAGRWAQRNFTIAIGSNAGFSNQSTGAIAIGADAGAYGQGEYGIALGYQAGLANQGIYSFASGHQAGAVNQGTYGVAVGTLAANRNQGIASVAVGVNAGRSNQQRDSVAIGAAAAYNNQSSFSVAIGSGAGFSNQGENSVAVGAYAGYENQSAQTVVLNATGVALNTAHSDAFYVAPVATRTNPQTFSTLYYDANTKEVFAGPVPNGGGGFIDSNFGFSNLGVLNTFSTSSTFTDYLSSGQIYTSSLIAQSVLIVGSNTLTVYGQTYMSSLTITGQVVISTSSGQGGFVDSNFGFSNLSVLDTLSTSSTFTNYLSTAVLEASTLKFADAFFASPVRSRSVYNSFSTLFYDNLTNEVFAGPIPAGGGSVSSNYAFSNLLVANTLSTSSTFTNSLSTTNLYTGIIDFANKIKIIQPLPQSIAIGYNNGLNQSMQSIAIGAEAGYLSQEPWAVAVGTGTGYTFQKERAVALGTNAGYSGQSKYAIAIGDSVGLNTVQGENSIGIGRFAGSNMFHSNTIVLNATGAALNTTKSNAFYVAPIATRTNPGAFSTLFYDASTKEVFAGPSGGSGSVSSNYSFSNLTVANTLSTSSTFTDYLSVGQAYVSSLVVGSAYVVGSNTLVVYGSTIMAGPTQITGTLQVNQITVQTSNSQNVLVVANKIGTSAADTLLYSTDDGVSWNPALSGGFSSGKGYSANKIAYGLDQNNSPLFIAAGSKDIYSPLERSTDGKNWNPISISDINIGVANDIAYKNNTWVAIFGETETPPNNTKSIQVSRDGGNTFVPPTSVENDTSLSAVAVAMKNETMFVAVGILLAGYQPSTSMYSVDGGDSWLIGGSMEIDRGYGIAYGNREDGSDIWVATGSNSTGCEATSTIQWSIDGSNWTSAVGGGFGSIGKDVAYLSTATTRTWVAVGAIDFNNMIPPILYSTDGSNWRPADTPSGFNGWENGCLGITLETITWTGSKWYAFGDNTNYSQSYYTTDETGATGWTVLSTAPQNSLVGSAYGLGVSYTQSEIGANSNATQNITITNTAYIDTVRASTILTSSITVSSITSVFATTSNLQTSNIDFFDAITLNSQTDTANVAIGYNAGQTPLGSYAVAIGSGAGQSQAESGISIGQNAGSGQGQTSIAIGRSAGSSQGQDSIAIGAGSGSLQGERSVAVGAGAGNTNQGSNAVAIGYYAGYTNQHSNTIVLNATGAALNTARSNAFYVAPIATRTNPGAFSTLFYDATTNEVFAGPSGGSGSINSNYSFSNLLVANTLSTSSIFTNSVSTATATVSSIQFVNPSTGGLSNLYVDNGNLFYQGARLNGPLIQAGRGLGDGTNIYYPTPYSTTPVVVLTVRLQSGGVYFISTYYEESTYFSAFTYDSSGNQSTVEFNWIAYGY